MLVFNVEDILIVFWFGQYFYIFTILGVVSFRRTRIDDVTWS